MADSKGTDPKANEARSNQAKANQTKSDETKSGAVKPPVLDMTARSVGADAGRPAAAGPESGAAGPTKPAATAAAGPPSTDKPKPDDKSRPASPTGPAMAASSQSGSSQPKSSQAGSSQSGSGLGLVGTALVGGLLGLGAAYGLAYAGLWPAAAVAPDARLASYGRAIPELETVTQTTQAELATLNQRVGKLEQTPSATAEAATPSDPIDLGPIESDIADLASRVDRLAAAPAPGVDSSALDALRSDFSALGGRIDELAARVGTAEANLRTIDATVSQTAEALAAQPSDIGAVLQLPLVLSGLETAFATGRPYESELAALRAAAPDAKVPTLIANQAAQGLTRPDVIARRFDAVLPAMLAGRPADPDAQWQKGALDWFAGAIALRPTGEIEGDTPDAITSRLIGAVERRDFSSAQTLLKSLPAPMQAAAGDVPALIAGQAEAEAFLQSVRDSALSGEVAR